MADCSTVPFCEPYDTRLNIPEGTALGCDDATDDPFHHRILSNFGAVSVTGNEERFNAAKNDMLGIRAHPRTGLTSEQRTELQNFQDNVAKFTGRGGSYYVAPLLKSTFEAEAPFKIHFYKGDVLLPVCHQGINRSQIYFLALQATAKQCGMEETVCISRVHGAESGLDPYQRYAGVTNENWFQYHADVILPRTAPGEWLHQNFYGVFGVDKTKRIGEECAADKQINPLEDGSDDNWSKISRDRTALRQQMDRILFDTKTLKRYRRTASGKVIFFCFMRAGDIMLRRLLEVSADCTDICIVALPWGDSLPQAGGSADIEKYFQTHGVVKDRDFLSKRHHVSMFQLYCSTLSGMRRERTGGDGIVVRPPPSGGAGAGPMETAAARSTTAGIVVSFTREARYAYDDILATDILQTLEDMDRGLSTALSKIKYPCDEETVSADAFYYFLPHGLKVWYNTFAYHMEQAEAAARGTDKHYFKTRLNCVKRTISRYIDANSTPIIIGKKVRGTGSYTFKLVSTPVPYYGTDLYEFLTHASGSISFLLESNESYLNLQQEPIAPAKFSNLQVYLQPVTAEMAEDISRIRDAVMEVEANLYGVYDSTYPTTVVMAHLGNFIQDLKSNIIIPSKYELFYTDPVSSRQKMAEYETQYYGFMYDPLVLFASKNRKQGEFIKLAMENIFKPVVSASLGGRRL
jgi:hypothetical protein